MIKKIILFGLLAVILGAKSISAQETEEHSQATYASVTPSGIMGIKSPDKNGFYDEDTPEEPPALVPATPWACAVVAGLPDTVERTKFCIHYTTNSITLAQAEDAADWVDEYWDRFVALGFNEPKYSGKLEVRLLDITNDCNGGTSWSSNNITTYAGCFNYGDLMVRGVLGHELTHRVQYAHDSGASAPHQTKMLKEGTARATEDNWFAELDTRIDGITSPFTFNKEVNNYLASTNADITSDPMRYMSALFWKYISEQYGTTTTEPERGIDFLLALYNETFTTTGLTAINNTLNAYGAGTNFDGVFRQFAVANWTKDLTGVPDGSYGYIDEDQVGNPAPYGPLLPANGGTINSVTPASWAGQVVNKYGIRYYSATPNASDCPVITANFTRTAGSSEFYHVVTQNGSAFGSHVEGSGASWTQSFLNNGITKVVAIVGGQSNSATVNVTLSCATPVINIEFPTQSAPAYVGSFSDPDDIIVQVSVTNGSPSGPVVGGLANADFSVEVGGITALVTGGGFVQEEYFLRVNTPPQGANGPYVLEVNLEAPGTSTVIASDVENEAVVYDNTNTDHVIVTDVSGSMGWDGKLNAAQDAANLFIDASNSTDGLGLVSYDHNIVDTLGVQFGTLPHRTAAHTQVNNYVVSGATSIGDGLNEAVTLRGGSPTGNTRCQFTLLSDGMENSALFWADVEAAVVATGCPVMTVAFGPASNETLMQEIATDTGGAAYYNDVYVSTSDSVQGDPADTELELADTYLYALCEGQECERTFTERGYLIGTEILTHTLFVDSSLDDVVFVLDWGDIFQVPGEQAPNGCTSDLDLRLISPSGTLYDPGQYAFADYLSEHVGYGLSDPEEGVWKMVVSGEDGAYFCGGSYQVIAYGQTDTAVELLLPNAQDGATGDYIPLYAIWEPGGAVSALVTAPDGTTTPVPLYDDGQHDDGAAGDGFFGGVYTLVTQALEVAPVDEGIPNPPEPVDEGAYQVHLLATLSQVQREAQGSFAVLEGADANLDNVPDDFIEQYCPGAPNSDADLDLLSCADEYFTGTDPNNSDTDFDGESDESEAIRHGLDPLNAGDDLIEALEFVQTLAQDGSVRLIYDVKAEYASMHSYRATSLTGPWSAINSLPLTGVYTDTTVTNETPYYYCLQAIDAEDHWSAVTCSEAVTPSLDPIPPEAMVLIDGGAATTSDTNVVLTFVPKEEEAANGEAGSFDDITQVMISNAPSFSGAIWQPFSQGILWQLTPGVGLRTVYVRFMDANGNESIGTETATIELTGSTIYLPVVVK